MAAILSRPQWVQIQIINQSSNPFLTYFILCWILEILTSYKWRVMAAEDSAVMIDHSIEIVYGRGLVHCLMAYEVLAHI